MDQLVKETMKAIVCPKYGSPAVLQLTELEIPIPKDNEALVEVHAASLDAADMEIQKGVFVNRIASRPVPKLSRERSKDWVKHLDLPKEISIMSLSRRSVTLSWPQ